jgi:hypothetical protein
MGLVGGPLPCRAGLPIEIFQNLQPSTFNAERPRPGGSSASSEVGRWALEVEGFHGVRGRVDLFLGEKFRFHF